MRLTIAVVLPTTTTSSMERRNTVFTVIHVQETNIQVGIWLNEKRWYIEKILRLLVELNGYPILTLLNKMSWLF
jgi:hypothetical protein